MKSGRFIGIDYGLARIGVSFSDEKGIIAFPLVTIKAEKKPRATLPKILKSLLDHQKAFDYTILGIVVGLPLLMSGKKGLMADEVEHFISELKILLPETEIIPWDERLSSVQADRSMREANFSRKKRCKFVDTVSAVIILQSYLDFKNLEK